MPVISARCYEAFSWHVIGKIISMLGFDGGLIRLEHLHNIRGRRYRETPEVYYFQVHPI